MRTIRIAYQTWTLDAFAVGEPTAKGWENAAGVACEPHDTTETAVDVAERFLRKEQAREASTKGYEPGVAYHAPSLDVDPVRGTYTRRTYHPTGFSEGEARELHRRITGFEQAR